MNKEQSDGNGKGEIKHPKPVEFPPPREETPVEPEAIPDSVKPK